jgi:hypothetical protein
MKWPSAARSPRPDRPPQGRRPNGSAIVPTFRLSFRVAHQRTQAVRERKLVGGMWAVRSVSYGRCSNGAFVPDSEFGPG